MPALNENASPFKFNFASATNDGSVFVAGISRELEDRDVPHTILWERVRGEWRRYQWKNRTYATAAHPIDGGVTAVYMGYEGTLKIRSTVDGSSEEVLEAGDDGPSSLRTVSSIRVVGDHLYVSGMRRMIYRRPLNSGTWTRFDEGVRQQRGDLALAGLYSIDASNDLQLCAVGIGGEIWQHARGRWAQESSPTNLTLLAVRCLADGRVVAGGEKGILLLGDRGQWIEVSHSFPDETFSCIERWRDRCFVASDAGVLYELTFDSGTTLRPVAVDGLRRVSWIAATEQCAWMIGETSLVSLSDSGWRDESPPVALLN